nr:CRISPR-associated helicase Cas3' [Ardenticatena sp.]
MRRHPNGLTEREIADHLNISRRTVNNYLRELEMEGRVYKDGRFWLPLEWEQTRLRPLELTPEEAIALYLGARLLSKQMDRRNEPAESALLKLANALRQDAGLDANIVEAARWLAQRPEDARRRSLFREVVRGYIYRRKVRLVYKPLNSPAPFETTFATYLIEPSLIGSALYLIGHSSRPNALRAYKLDRIQEISLTREEYTIPPDFAGLHVLQHAWNIMLGNDTTEVVLRFSPRVRERVEETIWHPSQATSEDPDREGWLRWRAHITHIQDILPWVRSWGADVEALAPPALQRALRREARRLMNLYFPDPRQRPPHLHIWAKAHRTDETFHPLLYHLLDTGACAEMLWTHALTPTTRAELARDLGLGEDDTRRLFVFLAAAHDIGKASPAFQTKVATRRQALCDLGYDFPSENKRGTTPHGTISTWILKRWLHEYLAWHRWSALRFAFTVGAHHGVWPTPRMVADLEDTKRADLGYAPIWEETRQNLLHALVERYAPPRKVKLPSDPTIQNRILTVLAGFITVADWLGSMEEAFPYEERVFTADEYAPLARERAEQVLKATGWLHSQPTSGEEQTFEQIFSFPPNPMQSTSIELASQCEHPTLLIVEAPTGQGKTELALYLADAWLQRRAGCGFYIAMPTQATSNAMYARVLAFLQERYPDASHRLLLVHSHADDHPLMQYPRSIGGRDGDDQASAETWFLPRKRALLAPFGVGTVDQALLGVLDARHHFLRLFGLAQKVVVFDEVHAYDTYMEHLFHRLLAWLRAIGTSVIVLSATLPRATREKLVQAWGEETVPHDEAPYPRVTLATPAGVESRALPPPSERTVALDWLDDDPAALAEWLTEQLANGGCVAIVCNTVSRAQEMYAAVRQHFSSDECLLFHARMPFAWREEREQQVLQRFGKEGERPHRFVVVATQVIEQSLDLDFDMIVTELAPIDLLIQRAGRLHRHPRDHRPAGLTTPHLWLLRPMGTIEEPHFGRSRFIYAPYVLWRTYLALQNRDTLHLPTDTETLIEVVYTDWNSDPAADALLRSLYDREIPPTLVRGLSEAWAAWQKMVLRATAEASRRLIPDVQRAIITDMSFEGHDDDTEAPIHPDLKALTRLMEPRITILGVHRQPDGRSTLTPDGEEEVMFDTTPSRATAQRWRRYVVQVQHHGLVYEETLPKPPAAWSRVAALRGIVPIEFVAGRAQVGPWILQLDAEFGLRIERKEEA